MHSPATTSLATAIAHVAPHTSIFRLLVCRPTAQLGLGCQSHRAVFTRSISSGSAEPLDGEKADALVLRFTEEERTILLSALQNYQAKKIKAEYEGEENCLI